MPSSLLTRNEFSCCSKAELHWPLDKSLSTGLHNKFWKQYIKHEEECFIKYPNTEKWVEKMRGSRVFLNQIQSVWISDETLFRIFNIASQGIDNSWRKSNQKFTEFYDN